MCTLTTFTPWIPSDQTSVTMRVAYFTSSSLVVSAVTAGFCPFLGPVFPAPKSLSTNAAFQASLADLESSITNALLSGSSVHGPLNSSDTYSIQIFSASDEKPLLDFHHRGANVFGNSVYRIASTTKVLTVYLLLLQAGDGILNDPVTKYLPELAGQDHWDDITVGSLAGYTSGIVSEGKLHPWKVNGAIC
jgi:hypothetical protein